MTSKKSLVYDVETSLQKRQKKVQNHISYLYIFQIRNNEHITLYELRFVLKMSNIKSQST